MVNEGMLLKAYVHPRLGKESRDRPEHKAQWLSWARCKEKIMRGFGRSAGATDGVTQDSALTRMVGVMDTLHIPTDITSHHQTS